MISSFAPNCIPTIFSLYLQVIACCVLSWSLPNQARYPFHACFFLKVKPSHHTQCLLLLSISLIACSCLCGNQVFIMNSPGKTFILEIFESDPFPDVFEFERLRLQ